MTSNDFIAIELPNSTTTPATLYRRPVADNAAAKPVMLVVPGGGYSGVCIDTEGYPIAERFEKLGFQVFILHYHVAPFTYPLPQQDILRAIRTIRHHAKEWGAIPNNLAICGFSAGGHLCCCAGTIWKDVPILYNDAIDQENGRPDAVILCYPVISSKPTLAHLGSFQKLLGDRYEAEHLRYALEDRVSPESAPMFIWHTVADGAVPYMNSVVLFQSLVKVKVTAELHLFPFGNHGTTLGEGFEDICQWPIQARAFLHGSLNFNLK